jgi:Tol biopolymer transport system component
MRGSLSALALALLSLAVAAPHAHAAFPGRNGRIVVTSQGLAAGCEYTCDPLLELISLNPDGSDVRRLEVPHSFDPAASPDGRRLAFQREGGIWTSDADGSHPRRLTDFGVQPSWSPDGRQIVLATPGGGDLYMVASGGGRPRRLGTAGSSPAWSPDGRTIAYLVLGGSHGDVYVTDPRGRRPHRLYRPPFAGGTVNALDWSPDGRNLVVEMRITLLGRAAAPGDPRRYVGIGVLSRDGRKYKRLTKTGFNPVWSPDGRRIALDRPGDRGPVLWMMDGRGRHQRKLLARESRGGASGPTWLRVPD